MIALVEGAPAAEDAQRDRADILLSGLTIIFLLAVVTLLPFAIYCGGGRGRDPGR